MEDQVNTAPGETAKKRYEPIRLEAEGNVSFHSEEVDVGAETLIMHILNRRPEDSGRNKKRLRELQGMTKEMPLRSKRQKDRTSKRRNRVNGRTHPKIHWPVSRFERKRSRSIRSI